MKKRIRLRRHLKKTLHASLMLVSLLSPITNNEGEQQEYKIHIRPRILAASRRKRHPRQFV